MEVRDSSLKAAQDLRVSLRLRYARFDTFDLCSTETSGSTLMLGTRDALGPDGTLDVRDGSGCGQPSLADFGSHDGLIGVDGKGDGGGRKE